MEPALRYMADKTIKTTKKIGSLAANTPRFLARGTKKAAIATYNTTSAVDRAINKKLAIKIKDSRIYQENNSEVFVMNDDLISKNLQDLGGQINKYYNKNRELNRKV